jgi:flavin reductase (DIM6/NTAB) family NADH-FMN oxidoreductase RutF
MPNLESDAAMRVHRFLAAKIDIDESGYDKLASPVGAVVVVTTIDEHGRVNAAPIATCIRNNHKPTCFEFTVDADKDTARNVLATGEFTVNVVPFVEDILEKVHLTAMRLPKDVDELAYAGLTAVPARMIRPPRIGECRSHFECIVEWTKQWFETRVTIVGRVVAASVDRNCIDEKGFVLHDKLLPTQYAGLAYGGKYFGAQKSLDIRIKRDAETGIASSLAPGR